MGQILKKNRKYRIMLVLCSGLILAAAAAFFHFYSGFPIPLVCAWYEITGLYCPGCGAGRACRAILQFHFVEAFCYNPVFVLLLPLFGLYFAVRITDWTVTGGNHTDRKISVRLLIVILILVLV